MSAAAEQYLSGMKRELHRDATMRATLDGFTVFLPCTGHGIMEAFHMRSKLPPDQIRKKLQDKGWTFDGIRRAQCPEHAAQAKERERRERTVVQPVIDKPSGEVRVEATDRARAAKRETVLLLEDVFDVKNGCYKGGESDDSVAKTVGLSPEAVKFIREDMFGPIKRPQELDGLFAEMSAINRKMDETQSNYAGEMECLRAALSNLKARVDTIARRYGA